MRQVEIRKKAGISKGALSNILSGRRRPSWDLAKILASVTGTTPDLWMDGTPEKIKKEINKK